MTEESPTRGQAERMLAQRIQALYKEQLGQRPERITCQFFDEKLAIVLEKIVTPVEQLLLETDRQALAQQLRLEIDEAIQHQLVALIQEIAGVSVKSALIKTELTHDYSGLIVLLDSVPYVRDPLTIPKVKKEKVSDRDNDE